MPIIKEIVKNLPVKEIYEDLAQPAAIQAGVLAEDVMKTMRLILFPVQFTGALQDRFDSFIVQSIRRIKPANLVEPAPQIVGPVLEGLKYEPDDTSIYKMFSNLLTNAMDSEQVAHAHPAYPGLVRQLSSDEAIILTTLMSEEFFLVSEADLEISTEGKALFVRRRTIEDSFPFSNLELPQRLSFYINHLNSLGLAGLFKVDETPLYVDDTPRKQTGIRCKSVYKLTDFGCDFVTACSRP